MFFHNTFRILLWAKIAGPAAMGRHLDYDSLVASQYFGVIVIYRGFDTATKEHRRLLNHLLLRRYVNKVQNKAKSGTVSPTDYGCIRLFAIVN